MEFEVSADLHTITHSVNRGCRRRSKLYIKPYLDRHHLNSVLCNELRLDTYLLSEFYKNVN
jgi:hypothetical protein